MIIYKAKKKNGLLTKSDLEQDFKQYDKATHDDYVPKKEKTHE